MSPPHIALITTRAARTLDEDMAPLQAALRAQQVDVDVTDWDDAAIDWSRYQLAVLRSTWDYTARPGAFLAWTECAAAATELLNPLAVVRWNIDKHYLVTLAEAGVAIVPSVFVAPEESAGAGIARFRASHAAADCVVKPCIGAGSRDTQRHSADAGAATLAHMQGLLDAGRHVLLQPYLPSVDRHGETSLLYFNGRFSHAIRKGPLLARDAAPTAALFAAEDISAREPSAAERALAERALAALPFAEPLTYARVDLIRDHDGQPCLLELELVEPSVFLNYAPGAADRFAGALLEHLRS